MARSAAADTVKASELDPHERVSVMFQMPAELKAKLEDIADDRGIAVAALVREIVADHFNYELPEIQRGGARRKYATDAEREAARKQKAADRNKLIKNLLSAYKSGKLDPEVLAALEGGEDEDEDDED